MKIANKEIGKFLVNNFLLEKELMFFGVFLSGIPKYFSDVIDTACVGKGQNNEVSLFINEEFWNSISIEEKRFLLVHETKHIIDKAWKFVKEYKLEDQNLANIAMDMGINSFCKIIRGIKIIEGAYLPTTYPELNLQERKSTLYYYQNLQGLQNKAKDEHKLWKELNENDKGEEISDIEQKVRDIKINTQVLEAIEEVQKSDGILPFNLKPENFVFEKKNEVVSWKKLLRTFFQSTNVVSKKNSKLRLNKRYKDLPGFKNVYKNKGVILIDSSGSMSNDDLKRANQELYNIWKAGTDLDSGYWDADVGEVNPYKGKLSFKRTKGGGTSIDPTIDYINKNSRKNNWKFSVIITDGYFSTNKKIPKIPTLVLLSRGGTEHYLNKIKTIQINDY